MGALLACAAVGMVALQGLIMYVVLRRERSFGKFAERLISELRLTRQSNGLVQREIDQVRDQIADDAKLRKDVLDTFHQRSA